MRVRALSPTGDMTFGQSQGNFIVDSPEAVAQIIMTRLRLWTNEWFLDLTRGTAWATRVLGKGTTGLYDATIQDRIRTTPGVIQITSYSSTLNAVKRALTVDNLTVLTQFGSVTIFPSNLFPPYSVPLGTG